MSGRHVKPNAPKATLRNSARRPAEESAGNGSVQPQGKRSVRGLSMSKVLIPITLGCSVLVASVMAFGNPVLWVTAEQQITSQYAEGTDEDDHRFIDEVAGEDGDTSDLVCLGEYNAVSQDDDPNRAANIELAAQALDGIEIKPGETFSFNETLGNTSGDERYFETSVVDGTTIVKGRGGGICQVSTALYIAALKADLEIVERYPHTIVSDYSPIGLDATVSYGQKDLRIKNNAETSVYIRVDALGQTVDVKLYGAPRADGDVIDPTSRIIERFDIPAYRVYGDPASLGLDPEDPVTYYVAESYRVLYRDGVMVSNDLLSTDTYQVSVRSSVQVVEGGVDPAK